MFYDEILPNLVKRVPSFQNAKVYFLQTKKIIVL